MTNIKFISETRPVYMNEGDASKNLYLADLDMFL